MIDVVIGTRAQLIKMAPVLREMETRGIPYRLLLTGQHSETIQDLFTDFRIATTPRLLYDGPEIAGIGSVPRWALQTLQNLSRLWKTEPDTSNTSSLVVVHGDTFSTLVAAIAARRAKRQVAHVEAGLRSFKYFDPFPEELTRLACFSLSDVAYCPGQWAYENMRYYSVARVDTEANTLLDAVRYAVGASIPNSLQSSDKFAIASIHRFENIFRNRRLRQIVSLLESAAEDTRLLFVLHPATQRRLEHAGLMKRILNNTRIEVTPRMGYVSFLGIISRARFVITDGGSNQEELSYLNKPTLLLRRATERKEGLGNTASLCDCSNSALFDFLANIDTANTDAVELPELPCPSRCIVDDIVTRRVA